MPLAAQDREPAAAPQGTSAGDARLQTAIAAGLAAMNAGDHAGALAHLAPVEDLAATRDTASYVFGLFYVNIGETVRALEWFDRALALRPAFPEALSARAVMLHRQGHAEEALAALDVMLALDQNDAEAPFMKGAILQGLGKLEGALEHFDRALELRPDYSEALLNRAAALEQLRRYEEALGTLDRLAALQPLESRVHFNRGSVLHQMGRFEDALAAYDQARGLAPHDPEAELNRGNVLQKLGHFEEAAASYGRALQIKPHYPQAYYNRGIALQRLGLHAEALAAFDAALTQRAAYPEALCNRGNLLYELGRLGEALVSYDAALQLRPELMQARINRANVLFKLQRYEMTLEACDGIFERERDHPQALCVQGTALQKLDRLDEALRVLDHALSVRPDFPEAWLNHGNVLQEQGRFDEALASYDRALALRPDYAEAISSRGVALKEMMRFDEALAAFDTALALNPDFADAHNNRAGVLLLTGDLTLGFEEFEWRWERSNAPRKTIYSTLPTWRGEPLSGRRILVWDEQGLGDLIQFCRYLLPLEALAGEVTLLGRPSTFRLLSTLAAPPRFIDKVADESLYDYQIALMSLPKVFGTSLASVPAPLAYLCAEPECIAKWRGTIGDRGYRIGICWRGNMKINLERSLPLAEFAKLAAIPGVRLFNLMKDGDDDIRSSNLPIERLDGLDAGRHAFLDTAAVMMNLDLVVTSDTSITHLAGALGRPTYLALKHVPDWRWLNEGETSPWYPTLRLFRQSTRGDWGTVFDRMAAVAGRA